MRKPKTVGSSATSAPHDLSWRVHENAKSWIVQVDLKATAALAIEAAILGLAIALVSSSSELSALTGLVRWCIATALVLLLASVILSILVLMPRIRLRPRHPPKTTRAGYLYFGDLRYWNQKALSTALAKDGIDGDDLAHQIIAMSRIAWRKHVLLKWSLCLLTAGIVILGVFFVVLVAGVAPDLINQVPEEAPSTGVADVPR